MCIRDRSEGYDEFFDKDMYMEAYQRSALGTDGNSVKFNEIPLEDLAEGMQRTYNTLLNNYSKTEEGEAIFQEIDLEKGVRLNEALNYAIENYIDDPVEFMKHLQNAHEKVTYDLYMGTESKLYKFNYNSGIAVESYFSKSITDREIEMNLEERYGFLSNWKFGTAIIKGFDVTLPKEHATYIMTLKSQRKTVDLDNLKEFLESFPGVTVDDVDLDKPRTLKGEIFNTILDQNYPYNLSLIHI